MILKSKRYKFFATVVQGGLLSVLTQTALAALVTQSNVGSTAAQLDWVAAQGNRCQGVYQAPKLPIPANEQSMAEAPLTLSADQSQVSVQGPAVFSGNVTVAQPGRLLSADKVTIQRDASSQKLSRIDLTGHVLLRTQHDVLRGEVARVDVPAELTWVERALFRLTAAPIPGLALSTQPPTTVWGKADKIAQQKQEIHLDNAQISACAPTHPFWSIRAKKITLDRESGWGRARNARFYIRNTPVAYIPYISFPIDNRRKSGFLFPLMAHSSRNGIDVSVPWYWNIAPNYDATFTPRFLQKRGLLAQAQFRYLTQYQQGEMHGGFLKHDRAFEHFRDKNVDRLAPLKVPGIDGLAQADTDRHFFSWQHHAARQHWYADIDYTEVSDDYLLHDIGGLSLVTTQSQLLQQAQLGYHGSHWLFNTRWQRYQALQRFDRPLVAEQYRRLPQITLSGDWVEPRHGVDLSLDTEWVYFERFKNPAESFTPVSARRLLFAPTIRWPMTWGLYAYLTPELKIHATQYHLQDQAAGVADYITRVVPILSVDSGLSLDRDMVWHNQSFTQSLEPRLFFLWAPYRSQNNIPTFDTSLNIFNYDQLFRWNRFNGIDRVGDAKQLAWSLTTRFTQRDSAFEAFRFSLGQLIYFEDRRVRLCSEGLCDENTQLADRYELPRNSRLSPLVALLRYAFHPQWYVTAHATYDVQKHTHYSHDVFLHFQPADNHIINAGLTFLRNGDVLPSTIDRSLLSSDDDLKQVEVSGAWPLTDNLMIVGRYQHNLSHHHLQSAFAGLAYQGCCWALRVVAGKAFKRLDEQNHERYDPAIFVQWQFTGLGSIGSSEPTHLLMDGIRGYRDEFAAHPMNFTL